MVQLKLSHRVVCSLPPTGVHLVASKGSDSGLNGDLPHPMGRLPEITLSQFSPKDLPAESLRFDSKRILQILAHWRTILGQLRRSRNVPNYAPFSVRWNSYAAKHRESAPADLRARHYSALLCRFDTGADSLALSTQYRCVFHWSGCGPCHCETGRGTWHGLTDRVSWNIVR